MPAATNGVSIGLSRYSSKTATTAKDSHCTAAKRDRVISGKIRGKSCSTLPLRKRELNLNAPTSQPSSPDSGAAASAKGAGLSYRDAGVDIDAGDRLVENIKPFARRTMRPQVLNRHDTVGIDLVGMSVNDILVQGAEPLFFLDYFACGKLDVEAATEVIKGIAFGCEQAGCALIGGETAEMPGMYPTGEYDLAGFAVGVVEKANIISGKDIKAGDAVIGLASNGAHSNGYSLVRKIIERNQPDLNAKFDGERTLADCIMAPTRIYVKPLLALMQSVTVKGMAHITGGGLLENIPRVLPENVVAQLDGNAWHTPKLFDWLREMGNVAQQEMYRTFNCGIGMVVIVDKGDAAAALAQLNAAGETATVIGTIRARDGAEAQTQVL